MSTYQEVVKVDITINAAGSTREGFGNPLFITGHDVWEERVRSYNSLTELAQDFPDGTAAYSAAKNLWAQQPQVPTIYIGRRNVQYTLGCTPPIEGNQYNLTLTVNSGIQQTFTYTGQSGDKAETVFTQLKTSIEAAQSIADHVTVTITGTEDNATMQITAKDPAADFVRASTTTTSDKMSLTSSSYGTAGTVLTYITEEFSDFYFVAVDDRTDQFILDMAAAVETMQKIFFMASSAVESLTGNNVESQQDLLAKLANKKYNRTVALWHQEATSEYVEMAYIGYGAPYDAGSITWGNAQLAGLDLGRHPTTGRPLTSAQKTALLSRNANFVDREGGLNIVRMGTCISGEWIDIIRGIDWLDQEVTVALRDLLMNQKGGKVTYNDAGITRIKEVISSALQRGVNRNLLDSYTVTVPRSADCSAADKRARVLQDVKFTGILAGAILIVKVQGSVTY
jgi:hypothetical protein